MYYFNNYFKSFLFSITLSVLLGACTKEDLIIDKEEPINLNKTSLLVYMVADNNLNYDALNNIEKIEEGLMNIENESNVFIYFDGNPAQLKNSPLLLKLSKSKNHSITTDTVKTYQEANSANKERVALVLNDFILETKDASRKGLILWSHGTGWLPACFHNCNEANSRAFGEDQIENEKGETPKIRSIDIKDLAEVIPHNTFEYIIFDACLMQSVEVAYQLRNKTDFIFGGVSLVPATGLSYEKLIPILTNISSDYITAAKLIFDEYKRKNDGGASYSLVKTSELENLASAVKQLFNKYSLEDRNKFSTRKIQGFDHAYGESLFLDFLDYLYSFATQEDLSLIKDQLNKTVLYKNSTKTVLSGRVLTQYPQYMTVNFFSGLSIHKYGQQRNTYLNIDSAYEELDWYKAVF